MTQEEKAKAYDEALEKAKSMHKMASETHYENTRMALEELFPELRDSEDERIRKEIKHHISLLEFYRFMAASKEECLSYLEKQKTVEWSEGAKKALDEAAGDYASYYFDCDNKQEMKSVVDTFKAGAKWMASRVQPMVLLES